MTKYILHGGVTKVENATNMAFYDEMASDIPEKGTILFVLFARPHDEWEARFTGWIDMICKSDKLPDDVNFECATPKRFAEQLQRADVVCVAGGDGAVLMDVLKNLDGAEDALRQYSKTIAGSSAGAIMLSAGGYDDDVPAVVEGFGIIQKKVLVHAGNPDYDAGLGRLQAFGDESMEIIHIPETEFVVVEQ